MDEQYETYTRGELRPVKSRAPGAYCGNCNKWHPQSQIVYGTPAGSPFTPADHYCRPCAQLLNVYEVRLKQ